MLITCKTSVHCAGYQSSALIWSYLLRRYRGMEIQYKITIKIKKKKPLRGDSPFSSYFFYLFFYEDQAEHACLSFCRRRYYCHSILVIQFTHYFFTILQNRY